MQLKADDWERPQLVWLVEIQRHGFSAEEAKGGSSSGGAARGED